MMSINQLQRSLNNKQDQLKLSDKKQLYMKDKYNKNKNTSLQSINSLSNKGSLSSKQLFHRCKQMIQQQMYQISQLTQLNQQLTNQLQMNKQSTNQLNNKCEQLQNKNNNLNNQLGQTKHKNQLLHKQINKLNLHISQQSKKLQQKDNIVKLTNNKIQLLQSSIHKLNLQLQNYKQKCKILQQTIQLMTLQNNKMIKINQQKDLQMKRQMQQLKKIKQMLQKRNRFQQIDNHLYNQIHHQNNYINRNHSINNLNKSKYFCIQDRNPFNTVQINRYPNKTHQSINKTTHKSNQLKTNHSDKIDRMPVYMSSQINKSQYQNMSKSNTYIQPFTTVDQRSNRSPNSRIRKNISKSKPKYQPSLVNININQNKSLLSIPHTNISRSNKQSLKHNSSFTNPQMQSQLSNIKKEIMQTYNKIQVKKQVMNQNMINKTLLQIQNKLKKMTQISALDESESQME